jgi:hypothetical protein
MWSSRSENQVIISLFFGYHDLSRLTAAVLVINVDWRIFRQWLDLEERHGP